METQYASGDLVNDRHEYIGLRVVHHQISPFLGVLLALPHPVLSPFKNQECSTCPDQFQEDYSIVSLRLITFLKL